QSAPQHGYQSAPQQRYQSAPQRGPQAPQQRGYQQPQRGYQPAPQGRYESTPQRSYQVPRPYSPPAQGHHSGQWLNQYRQQPLDQQRHALENDPKCRRLPPPRQQQLKQRVKHFAG